MSDVQCSATTNTGFEWLNCEYAAGHPGQHHCRGYRWHSQPSAIDLTGRTYEDLLLELFTRVAALETVTPQDEPDGSEMQTETRITAMLHRIVQTLEDGFARIIERLPAPPPPVCGAPSLAGNSMLTERCELPAGHEGRHREGISTWPNRPNQHFEPVAAVTHPEYAERVSGSPAPVPASSEVARCPTLFREGQCLGYAGHDGDCSALPDSGNPQLEDPSEFEEPTTRRCEGIVDGLRCTLRADHTGHHSSMRR